MELIAAELCAWIESSLPNEKIYKGSLMGRNLEVLLVALNINGKKEVEHTKV